MGSLGISGFFIFYSPQEKSAIDWEEKEISFSEYLEKITRKAIEERKSRLKEKSNMYNNLMKKQDQSMIDEHK